MVARVDAPLLLPRDLERFWSRVNKTDACWGWTGGDRFHADDRQWSPQRIAWLIAHGAPAPNAYIYKTCGNEVCVRPDHLISPSKEELFWSKVEKGPGCWEWRGATNGIYAYGSFGYAPGKTIAAHRYSWELHNGSLPPDGLLVCHRCDNPICVRPDHLFLGTDKDNHLDCMSKGRHAHGERLSKAIRDANAKRRSAS